MAKAMIKAKYLICFILTTLNTTTQNSDQKQTKTEKYMTDNTRYIELMNKFLRDRSSMSNQELIDLVRTQEAYLFKKPKRDFVCCIS